MTQFRTRLPCRRQGQIILLFALFLVALIAMLAFSMDVGMVAVTQTDLQRSADSAALAGARDLIEGREVAVASGKEFARLNLIGNHQLDDNEIEVEVGKWDYTSRSFTANRTPLDAVRVVTTRRDAPFFFGKALGRAQFTTQADAVATARPRDIMLVLDISGSMNGSDKLNQLKRAVDLFCGELIEQNGRDQLGVAVYSSNATLLAPLSFDINNANKEIQKLKAKGSTNISSGMTIGRTELESKGRSGAAQLIVLLTDGLVNQPNGAANGRTLVVKEANLAKDKRLPIVTISFSKHADPTLMQEVADITKSVHFHVEGSVSSQEAELRQVFLQVAANRPLQLVD